jgi:hypothetical protein
LEIVEARRELLTLISKEIQQAETDIEQKKKK